MLIFQVLVMRCMPKIVCGIAKLMMTISFANKILKLCEKIEVWNLGYQFNDLTTDILAVFTYNLNHETPPYQIAVY